MGISPKTGKFLIQRGYGAVHLIDIGMERLSDTQIFLSLLFDFISSLAFFIDNIFLIAFSSSSHVFVFTDI